ncbi:protein of unknown function (plasmid) [Candidatus Promineifilum breve]|uniref:Uncharacterized protein n=1 Tax=Candidatus Promineifilum breve TaxID=1806508 RepID=A0A160TBB1_9CHLR|nr:hypothetical protein [Candidatus Promineifilum breve]CUS06450.1 protein of unknown function [Candidatus Promineifilum breve]
MVTKGLILAHLRQWLRALLQSNKEPQMVFLDKVNNKATALRIETDWILTLKAAGVPLTNRLYPGHEDWGRESRLARRKR